MTFKQYSNGDILTADDANLFMRQGLIVVANNAARDSIPLPTEGMRVYRLDTHVIETFTGTAWIADDSGFLSLEELANGWSPTAGHGVRLRRSGKRVSIVGGATRNGTTGAQNNILTIPSTYRPGVNTFIGSTITSAGQAVQLFVDLNGILQIPHNYSTAALTANVVVPVVGSWYLP